MTLTDVAADLFLYLVTFRRQIRKGMTPEMSSVRAQIKDLIDEMENRVRDDAEISRQYEKVKYILVILADEILINSDWGYARAWEDNILEWEYFKSREAGQKFFELLDEQGMSDDKLAEIYFIALSLGFLGMYAGDQNKIAELKRRLYRMLPGRLTESDTKITPDAYYVGEGVKDIYRPVANFGMVAVICLVMLVGAAIVYPFIRNAIKGEIPKKLKEMKLAVPPMTRLAPMESGPPPATLPASLPGSAATPAPDGTAAPAAGGLPTGLPSGLPSGLPGEAPKK